LVKIQFGQKTIWSKYNLVKIQFGQNTIWSKYNLVKRQFGQKTKVAKRQVEHFFFQSGFCV
jgi:hypothetical protein